MRDDYRQSIFMLRTNMNEMDIQPIDLSDELGQGIQPRFALPPVVFRAPIARERLGGRELDALGCTGDRFPFRPLRVVDAPAQFCEFRLRDMNLKRTNWGGVS